jgi:hypothetical protein
MKEAKPRRRIYISKRVMHALRRGEIAMEYVTWEVVPGQFAHFWLEIRAPEMIRVADISRDACPRDQKRKLSQIDRELARADILLWDPPPEDALPEPADEC